MSDNTQYDIPLIASAISSGACLALVARDGFGSFGFSCLCLDRMSSACLASWQAKGDAESRGLLCAAVAAFSSGSGGNLLALSSAVRFCAKRAAPTIVPRLSSCPHDLCWQWRSGRHWAALAGEAPSAHFIPVASTLFDVESLEPALKEFQSLSCEWLAANIPESSAPHLFFGRAESFERAVELCSLHSLESFVSESESDSMALATGDFSSIRGVFQTPPPCNRAESL